MGPISDADRPTLVRVPQRAAVQPKLAAGVRYFLFGQDRMSNAQKLHSLKTACEVAGIPFGDRAGLYIDLPNA